MLSLWTLMLRSARERRIFIPVLLETDVIHSDVQKFSESSLRWQKGSSGNIRVERLLSHSLPSEIYLKLLIIMDDSRMIPIIPEITRPASLSISKQAKTIASRKELLTMKLQIYLLAQIINCTFNRND
jgi:hypothetical protein